MTNLLVAGQLPRWRNPPTTVVHAADAGLRRLHNACMKRMAPMIPPSRPGADAHGRRRQLLHAGPEPDHEKPARVGARARLGVGRPRPCCAAGAAATGGRSLGSARACMQPPTPPSDCRGSYGHAADQGRRPSRAVALAIGERVPTMASSDPIQSDPAGRLASLAGRCMYRPADDARTGRYCVACTSPARDQLSSR